MKFLQLLFRAGLGIAIGFILSLSSATIFFDTANYKTIDLVFLILVPTLAIAYLFFEAFPILEKQIKQTRIETINISFVQYLISFGLSLLFVYGAVGFLDEVLKTLFSVMLFTLILIPACSLFGYYLVRRAAHSFQDGFLHKPLNIILCLILPILFIAILSMSAQFPEMFLWEYITIPQNFSGIYFASAFVSGVWGIVALGQFEAHGYYQKFSGTKLFAFIKENLPGLYAGGMFFLINLIIARALNHPAFSYNSVLFETDAGPWMTILGSPASDAINRSVHPLVLITTRPLIRSLGIFMGEHWNLAPILISAAMSGACVLMAWLFVKRATGADTYSFIFAILLGSTATHLLFGSLTENYVFGMTSLIFFFLLIQAGENRLSRLVPIGVIVFGITITNIAQTAIGLFLNKFGFWKVARYCFLVVTLGVTLTVFTSVIYPHAETFFFVPADLAFEGNFVKPDAASPAANLREKVQVVARTMFLYDVIAPDPLIVVSQKKTDPFPTIDLKTFDWRDHKLASYKGPGNFPLVIWLMFLAGAFLFFAKRLRTSTHMPLMLGLLGSLSFNFIMHMTYGTELFLYTPYWVYALIFFIALSYAELANKKWFEILLALFVVIVMVNNSWFIFTILRALAPFFASS